MSFEQDGISEAIIIGNYWSIIVEEEVAISAT